MEFWIITGAAFFGVVTLIGAAAMMFRASPRSEIEHRLDVMTNPALAALEKYGFKDEEETPVSIELDSGPNFLEEKLKNITDLKMLFRQADTKMQSSHFFILTFVLFVVGIGVAAFYQLPIIWGIAGGLTLSLLPFGYLLWKRKKRFCSFFNAVD